MKRSNEIPIYPRKLTFDSDLLSPITFDLLPIGPSSIDVGVTRGPHQKSLITQKPIGVEAQSFEYDRIRALSPGVTDLLKLASGQNSAAGVYTSRSCGQQVIFNKLSPIS